MTHVRGLVGPDFWNPSRVINGRDEVTPSCMITLTPNCHLAEFLSPSWRAGQISIFAVFSSWQIGQQQIAMLQQDILSLHVLSGCIMVKDTAFNSS